ncbi:alpha/beta fold hydrolase [Brevibacillus ruminantium]|uniref:Alpha/beta fold hydrolase n=1 Tax=Brevibacillus ruminantium TaxID=2950604 RepID=A0ABY4WIQ5_9BACL|nr:alpha/beta fold hydrolase [Brevibacillus ruminantium]USG66676.1 alpha/beta fold hydrolase [Brevibacillus ruminantium]
MKPTVGCLVLHGFAGTTQDVLPLALALQKEGFPVECPTLEGHGLGRKGLTSSTRLDWLRSADEGYKRLSMRADEIIVIGFSMGGLLAVHLVNRYPARLLITVNTPFAYWDIKQAAGNLRSDFPVHSRRYLNSLVKIPVRSMLQFRRLLAETKPLLSGVSLPYVLLQSRLDDTVQSRSAELLAGSVAASAEPQIHWFDHSGHMIFHDADRDEAISCILAAVRRHASFPEPAKCNEEE